MFDKIDVNGSGTHPIFVFLKAALDGTFLGSLIKWNFTKFLVDRHGVPKKRHGPKTSPLEFESDIKELLEEK
jgi:glutathione peroxidase-family protein